MHRPRRRFLDLSAPVGSRSSQPSGAPPRWLIHEAGWLRYAVPAVLSIAAAVWLATQSSSWVVWLVLFVGIWLLTLRRHAPTLSLAVGAIVFVTLADTRASLLAVTCVLIALYNVAVRRSLEVAAGAGAAAGLVVAVVATGIVPSSLDGADVVLIAGLVVAALLLGTTLGANRQYLGSLQERAQRMDREREQQDQLVMAAERTRIAREMHDVVAHGLTVVITMSQGAAANAVLDPQQAQEAMQQVAGVARQSLGEMRRLLGVLRDDEPRERTPQPDLSQLDCLLGDVRATGLDVRLTRRGEARLVGPALQATLYRLIQESLTNVITHAAEATSASVELTVRPHTVRFVVEDDGRAVASARSRGRGLAGMRERVAMFDGTLDVGPSPAGWRVAGELHDVS